MRIGILGGTGPAGTSLAARLASIGYTAVIGSRSKYRAMEARDALAERWPALADSLQYGDNDAAADCDVVVIATPWDSAATTAQEHADALAGKVVISMANALVRVGHEFQPLVPPRGSVAAHVQAAIPRSRVVAAFHHLPATELGQIGEPIDSDVLICGDDPEAVAVVSDIVARHPRLSPAGRRRAVQRHRDRGVHGGAVAAQRALPHAGRAEVDGHPVDVVTMRLYDTARRAVVPFEPPEHVLMYTCGITPYDATHLGHAATYLAYDVLQRRLIDLGHRVTCVRNVTDVDDPLFAKARQLGVHYLDLAAEEEARFDADMDALNTLPVAVRPRASSAIPDIRGFIGMVLDRGYAYTAGGAVYFDVSKFARFGTVGNYTRDEMLALARRARWRRRQPGQARPPRLRAVAAVGARRAVLGHAVGSGPARLAHRVQRAGAARAGLDDPPPRWRHRPDLPAPRVRAGPVRGRDRGAVRASLDAHRVDLQGRREDVEEPRQPRLHRRPAQGVGPGRDPRGDHRSSLPRRVGVGRRS